MAEFFGKGISVGSGFDLGANLPLDNRTVQATLADRDSMPTIQLVEGLFVYVKENKTAYILKGFDPDGSNRVWETLATGTVVEIINSLESDKTDAALSAAQGKALKTLIDDLKASVAAALDKKVDKTITITGTGGLSGGGNLAESRTISHAVPAGAAAKTSGLYKIATDKFGHVTGTTAVAKTDITALGIPAADTNTTYTFAGGTNKFTVTPSNGAAQDISVTPSIANNVTKTAAATTAGYIPKFNNTTGVIENGYSVQTTLASSSTAIPTAAAVVAAIDNKIAAADAMIYKGTLGTDGTVTKVPANGYKVGWTYKVITAGTYAGIKCEVGDMLIAINNGPISGTTVVNADWTVVQANIDGAVTGPASATAGHIAVFDGATGKVIKDGTYTIATSVPSNAVFTDTKVTSVDNHYKPANGTTLIGTAGSPVTAGGKVITGITADSSGHITGIITGTIPAAPTLSGLGGVGTINASGTAPLTLSASKSSTTVTISGSVAEMTAATSNTAGAAGIVPAPDAGKQAAFLRGDGTWAFPTDTNTTYVFANGTDGSFTVTPRNGESQKVLIGKPATAGSADNATQVKNSLIITLNSGSNDGTTKFTFNGSAQKTVNITPGSIGAATSAQGTKADNAVPEVTFTSSSLNVSAVKDSESKKVALTAEMEWVEFE